MHAATPGARPAATSTICSHLLVVQPLRHAAVPRARAGMVRRVRRRSVLASRRGRFALLVPRGAARSRIRAAALGGVRLLPPEERVEDSTRLLLGLLLPLVQLGARLVLARLRRLVC